MAVQLLESWLLKEQANIQNKYRDLNTLCLKDPQVIFAGDSIVEYFPLAELLDTTKTIVNRGIRGYQSSQLLEHRQLHFFGGNLETIVLLIGTNDLGKEVPLEQTLANLEQLLYLLQHDFPLVEIKLLSILPVYESPETKGTLYTRTNRAIDQMNQAYQELALRYPQVEFVDVGTCLRNELGQLREDCTTDGLHLTVAGYARLAKELQGML
ncbi:SGNH/GDSL hydrolase family protein [Streptococcus sp. NLN76]|uniref:SGNH/GDSL hydrolase family protein n=1 Tax=Streptococcus sp. NLN76 TaxID=2822800 RepID=UPI0018A8FEAC|nr:SGNH/GDSL hydrolase family protein [Streptococcus sp. NLN76]MBF8970225.1 1-alkyl-2-acetylglycerophosphocholine esterase [Streptococcus sp. NLN76]